MLTLDSKRLMKVSLNLQVNTIIIWQSVKFYLKTKENIQPLILKKKAFKVIFIILYLYCLLLPVSMYHFGTRLQYCSIILKTNDFIYN